MAFADVVEWLVAARPVLGLHEQNAEQDLSDVLGVEPMSRESVVAGVRRRLRRDLL